MTSNEGGPRLMSVAEAAVRLSLSVRSVRALIASGQLAFVRVSARRIGIDARDLDAWIETRRVAARGIR